MSKFSDEEIRKDFINLGKETEIVKDETGVTGKRIGSGAIWMPTGDIRDIKKLKPNFSVFRNKYKKTKMDKYIESKEVKLEELEKKFDLIKEWEGEFLTKVCPNCGETTNFFDMKSDSWTIVKRCNVCNTITLAIMPDCMGGNHSYTVKVFGEKK